MWFGTGSDVKMMWDTTGTDHFDTDLGANEWDICNGACTSGHTPAVFVEGIFEIDGACYMDGGAVVTGDNQVSGQYYDTALTTSTPAGTTQEIDWANGNVQKLDLEDASGNVTLTFANLKATAVYQLIIQQDGGGNNRTVTFPTSAQFVNGALNPYALTVTATGTIATKTTVLLTPEEIDAAGKMKATYSAPGK